MMNLKDVDNRQVPMRVRCNGIDNVPKRSLPTRIVNISSDGFGDFLNKYVADRCC